MLVIQFAEYTAAKVRGWAICSEHMLQVGPYVVFFALLNQGGQGCSRGNT